MGPRPKSVTIISWILIVTGALSVLSIMLAINNPQAIEVMNKSPLPISIQYVMIFLGTLVSIGCGIAMLQGRNWSRLLYVGWSVLGLLIGIFTSPTRAMLIPNIVFLAVIAFFLFRPKATAFFTCADYDQNADDNPDANNNQNVLNTVLKFIRIILYIIGGSFLCTACVFSFMSLGEIKTLTMKIIILGIFAAIGGFFIFLAMATNGFKNWKMPVGITFLSVVGFNAFIVFVFVCMSFSPEVFTASNVEPIDFRSMFGDYLTGIITHLLLIITGLLLVRSHGHTNT